MLNCLKFELFTKSNPIKEFVFYSIGEDKHSLLDRSNRSRYVPLNSVQWTSSTKGVLAATGQGSGFASLSSNSRKWLSWNKSCTMKKLQQYRDSKKRTNSEDERGNIGDVLFDLYKGVLNGRFCVVNFTSILRCLFVTL